MRVIGGGTHTFTVAAAFPVVTAPATQNLNIDFLFVGVGTAVAAGTNFQVQANGIVLAAITPVVSSVVIAAYRPLVLPAGTVLRIVPSAVSTSVFYYSYAGDET